jgi:hypothetical protein
VGGERIRSNVVVRHVTAHDGTTTTETIARNAKRLVPTADLGRSCLTCDLEGCAGRVTIR